MTKHIVDYASGLAYDRLPMIGQDTSLLSKTLVYIHHTWSSVWAVSTMAQTVTIAYAGTRSAILCLAVSASLRGVPSFGGE